MPRGRPKGATNKVSNKSDKLDKKETSDKVANASKKRLLVTLDPLEQITPIEPNTSNTNNSSTSPTSSTYVDSNLLSELPDEAPTKKKGRQPKTDDEKYDKCERCGEYITGTAYTCNTNYLTGRADYFREAPLIVKLCGKCSIGLSAVVDKYLVNGGNGAMKPWNSIKYYLNKNDPDMERDKE